MTDHSEKTVEDLREELRERGLRVSGNKKELVDRLTRDDTDAAAGKPEAEREEAAHGEERGHESRDADLDVSAVKDELAARLQDDDADASGGRSRPSAGPRTEGRMPSARQRATDRLVQIIGEHQYPSHEILDRLERSLRNPSDLEAYAWILSKITETHRYPSLRLLDRLDACALAHEFTAGDQGQEHNQAGHKSSVATNAMSV